MKPKVILVTRAERGRSLAALLRNHLQLSLPAARQLIRAQRVRLEGRVCVDPTRMVIPGQRLEVLPSAEKAKGPPAAADRRHNALAKQIKGHKLVLVHADSQVVVVDKPPGLTTVRHAAEAAEFGKRARRFLPPTVAELLPGLLPAGKSGRPLRVRAVHRLDKDTSGLVVFACTAEVERDLGQQMRAHEVERHYVALVRGQPRPGRIESHLINDRGDGRRGSSDRPGEGKLAITHVKVLEHLGAFALVECRLETGRTHQVRIHLGERGNPLCGERVYDRPRHGRPLPDGSGASRPMLHAATLGFRHPATGKWVSWKSPLPEDMDHLLARLRQRKAQE